MLVTPTPKFSKRTIQVPFHGPVSRKSSPAPIAVTEAQGRWLLEQGFVTLAAGEVALPEPLPATDAPTVDPVDIAEPVETPAIAIDDPRIAQFLEALPALTIAQLSDAEFVGKATAKKIKQLEEPTWEAIAEILNDHQQEALLNLPKP